VAFENLLIKIHSFETGEKCMEGFMEVVPDLVILDYYLNSKSTEAADGLQVLEKIKMDYLETSVIMLTSNDHIDIALKSFHYGASDYVVKTESQFKKIKDSISNIFANKELAFENQEKEKRAVERIISDKELSYQNREKEKRAAELIIVNIELAIQNEEQKKRATELIAANKELVFQYEERKKSSAELIVVNKKLAFQYQEVEKRALELTNANTQKAEAEKSKLVIEKKNKDITDSINYAKRIQQAKLPRKEKIYASLPQCFILFKPKDIVSGDFYFFHNIASKVDQGVNGDVFIVAADCTGHGVPGAFMSLIGSEKLEDAVAHSSDTSEILKHLNIGIKNSLHQSDGKESTRDGMDIAICSVDTKNRIIKYAGANRPLWLIKNGKKEVVEIKGTKKAIGGWTDDDQNFDSHELKLQKGDTFYLSTDGFVDQFGGQYGKKLMAKKFKEILVDIQSKSMLEQEIHLDNFVEDWKAGAEQVDDILIIGVRL
jgi:serine phosphatase RsbU (regulator of sigma subunit)